MKKKFTIKTAPLADTTAAHNAIPELEEHNEAFFSRRISGRKHLNLVAYVGKSIAGYNVSYDKFGDGSIYCWMTGVAPRYRRMGILTAMMQQLIRWAKQQGFTSVKLKTRNNRREMLSYLVTHGYNIIEVIPKDRVEDNRIVFEKKM